MPSLVTLIDGTVPVAADFNGNYTALNNAIGSSTAISTWVTGEIPYASATDTLSRLAPGAVGKVLTMNATVPEWQGGAWVTPGFSAGDYTASASMTWTVASGDVTTYAFCLIGKTMHLNFNIETTTVGGTPSTELRIAIPAAKVAAKTTEHFIHATDNGTAAVGVARIAATSGYVACFRNPADFTTVWTASTDNTAIVGSITFEVT